MISGVSTASITSVTAAAGAMPPAVHKFQTTTGKVMFSD